MKILYVRCLCKSADRVRAEQLRKQGYEIRETNKNAQWRSEAAAYKLKMPFIVEGENARLLR